MVVRDGIGNWYLFGVTVVRAERAPAVEAPARLAGGEPLAPSSRCDLLFELIPLDSPFVGVRYYGGLILTFALALRLRRPLPRSIPAATSTTGSPGRPSCRNSPLKGKTVGPRLDRLPGEIRDTAIRASRPRLP